MAFKIYIKNNYLIIDDTVTNKQYQGLCKDVFIYKDLTSEFLYNFTGLDNEGLNGVNFQEIINENNIPFSTDQSWIDFYTEATGKFSSPNAIFNPSDYDLNEFTNLNIDPFVKISELTDYQKETIVVTNYNSLPDPTTVIGEFYWCSNSQGSNWNPFVGSFKNSGMYYSNGVIWEFLNVPYQATQALVDAGINNDQFVTPSTFENASKWLSKADLSYVDGHITNTSNPHNVTKSQIGLSNVDNTSDINKPVSTAQATAINLKEDSINKSNLTTDSASSIKFPVWSAIVSYFDINRIKTILGITTLSGSNTGDQTSIVGITGTKAQFNTAVTDGDIQYVGDAPTAHTHTLSNVTDVTMTVANLNSLDDGVNSNLHFHDTDRARVNHTGTQLASTISDIQTTITNNASVTANTAKVSNATHTGEVTGATALTIGANVVTNAKLAQMTANTFKANNTGATANANDITPTQAKSLLAITNTDVSGLGTLSTQNGTFSGSSSGTNTGDETNGTIISKIGFIPYNSTNPSGYISSYTETDPVVRAINGIVKSNGTTISNATSVDINNTFGIQPNALFYATPNASAGTPSLRSLVVSDIPILNQNTTGTASNITGVTNTTLTSIPNAVIGQSQVTNLTADLNNKQNNITLTTTGTSGQATLVGSTLNIPNYAPAGGSGLTFQQVMRLTKIR